MLNIKKYYSHISIVSGWIFGVIIYNIVKIQGVELDLTINNFWGNYIWLIVDNLKFIFLVFFISFFKIKNIIFYLFCFILSFKISGIISVSIYNDTYILLNQIWKIIGQFGACYFMLKLKGVKNKMYGLLMYYVAVFIENIFINIL